jgi:hypothetical protein
MTAPTAPTAAALPEDPPFGLDHDMLNTITKYPSIGTFHPLLVGGILGETTTVEFTGPVHVSEKIDGQNIRVIFLRDGRYVIGTREKLLHCSSDYLCDNTHGIVPTLIPLIPDLRAGLPAQQPGITVYYMEIFGGTDLTRASRQYTSDRVVGLRLFDIATIPDPSIVQDMTKAQAAAWRDRGGPSFHTEQQLQDTAPRVGLPLTPRLTTLDATELPVTVAEAHHWIGTVLPGLRSRSVLDENASGEAEGVVLTNTDHTSRAKLKLANYTRTARMTHTDRMEGNRRR